MYRGDGDPPGIMQRMEHVVGLDRIGARVLQIDGYDVVSQNFQSDRSYPPFLSSVGEHHEWFAPATGVVRWSSGISMAGFHNAGPTFLGAATAAFWLRDTTLLPSDAVNTISYSGRPLNAWAVVRDWKSAADSGLVSVRERCAFRDYPRLVLSRRGPRGEERLFVDEKSGFPVKLERVEAHYLWGQSRVEYVYSTWQRLGDASFPGVSHRVVDGEVETERSISAMRLVAPDSAPALRIPNRDKPMGYAPAGFLVGARPDTIRVGPTAFLLKNAGYTEMVVEQADTVFLLDATQGEERARQDSIWIATLFPRTHHVAVVVTDLAWPHIAGVRYWVARGAPIYAHRAGRALLDSVIARRWTLAPDYLERTRRLRGSAVKLLFHPVSDSLKLANGGIVLFPIDGVASEVALAAFTPSDRFLWASDYIQTSTEPSMYLDEVCRALTRVGRTPERVAAEHLGITAWAALAPLAHCG